MVIVFRNSPHDKGSKSVESLRRHALIYAQGTLFLTRLCELKKKKNVNSADRSILKISSSGPDRPDRLYSYMRDR